MGQPFAVFVIWRLEHQCYTQLNGVLTRAIIRGIIIHISKREIHFEFIGDVQTITTTNTC